MSLSSDRRVSFCAATCVWAVGIALAAAQPAPALSALTVPAASLPTGCHLTPLPPLSTSPSPRPAPIISPEGGVVVPGEMPNPWFGTDYKYIVQVRKAFEEPPYFHMPDGPPLEQKEVARLRAKMRGNISEAYSASYTDGRAGLEVQAVRYTDAKWATPDQPPSAPRPDAIDFVRIVRDSTVILLTGNMKGDCFKAVRGYIQSLK